jgi:hypothetical protein
MNNYLALVMLTLISVSTICIIYKAWPSLKQTSIPARIYRRMAIFASTGFVVFSVASWLRLEQIDAIQASWNPYVGPPPLLTCLYAGGVGLVLGALASLIGLRSK